jgi:hypothetical protein
MGGVDLCTGNELVGRFAGGNSPLEPLVTAVSKSSSAQFAVMEVD